MTQVKPSGQEGPPPAYPPPPMAYNPAPVGAYPPQHQPPPPGYYPNAYGAQQPGYPPPQQQAYGHTSTTVVVQQQPGGVFLAGGHRFYSTPATVQCQHCQATVTTSTSYTVGTYAWLIAAVIFIVGCWAGCCLIPFCVDGCKDVVHSCPNCRGVVGRYSRL